MQYKVTKRRLQLSVLLTVIAVLLVGLNLSIFVDHELYRFNEAGMGLILLLLLLGCYAQSVEVHMRPVVNVVWMAGSFLLLPFLMVHVIEYLSGHDVSLLSTSRFALNYFWCQMVYITLFALTNHYRWSVGIGTVVCYLVGGVNHFVQAFRGSPFQLTDILAAGTAADVAGSYIIAINYELLMAGSVTFLAMSFALWADYHRKRRNWKTIGVSVLLLTYVVGAGSYFYSDKLWQKYGLVIDYWNPLLSYTNNGTMLSFAMGAKNMNAEEPDNYTAEQVNRTVQQMIADDNANITELGMGVKLPSTTTGSVQYVPRGSALASATTSSSITMPNIIAIMNESYADMSVLGSYRTSVPTMAFMHSLNENTIKGNLSVSVLGGGTCNTEFEFLTGLNMAFLPSGVMSYSQYVNSDLESMATILKDQGYTSIAFHPGKAGSWARDKVYPYMGFEAFYTAEDMTDPVYMRDAYITDSSNYQKVIELFEAKKPDEKLFLFNVTIQNHGGYCLDTVGIPKWVSLMGEYGEYVQAEQYFSILRASDTALKELIDYFKQVDEPTMIVFFGDHQPNLETEFMEALLGKSLNALNMEEVQSRYQVPFFIWTNYDIEEAYYENISVNYLSTLAMELAGVQLPEYNQYLSKLYQTLPVVNALGYADTEGNYHYFSEENELTQYLEGYELVQYDYLFGKKNRVDDLYSIETIE